MTQAISFLFHILFFFTPLLLWPRLSEVFEFPKMLFVYSLTTLVAAAWILGWTKNKKVVIHRTPLDIPILLFLLSQILSTLFSIDPYTSLWGYYSRFHGGLASTISYIILFYALTSHLARSHNPQAKAKEFIKTILLSTILISAYAILERLGIDKDLWVQDVQSRVFSTLGQPNWLSAYLVAVLPIPIYLFLNSLKSKKSRQRAQKFSYFIITLSILASIIFTKSQSGLAATGIVLLIILTTQLKHHVSAAKLTLALPILLAIFWLVKPQPLIKSLVSLNKINPFYSTTQEIAKEDLRTRQNGGSDSMAIRRVVWQGAIDLGKKHPLLGTGVETFAYSYYNSRPASHNLLSEWNFLYNKAHNEYLNFFATTGILGLATYLTLIAWILRWWLKNTSKINTKHRSRPTTTQQSSVTNSIITTALLIGWTSILITNFFGFSVVAVALLFWLFPALAISLAGTPTKTQNKPISIKLLLPRPVIITSVTISVVYLFISLANTLQADIAYNLGRAYAAANQSQSSLQLLEKAVNLQPKQPLFLAKLAEQEARVAAAIFLQREELPPDATKIQQQYQKQALLHSEQASRMNPYNPGLLKSKAKVEVYLSNINPKYKEKALNSLLQASILAPTDPKLLLNIGILYQMLEKPKLAIASYQRALDLKPNYQEAQQRLTQVQP